MEIFLDILRTTFPAILLLILAYLMLTTFLENDERRRQSEIRKASQIQALPVRMQAYERLTLFLERISPNSIFVRVPANQLSVKEYLTLMQLTIRNEYEYNLSQQIYISTEAWQMVTTAKNATVSILNQQASTLDPTLPGVELAKRVLEYELGVDSMPTTTALNFLRNEAYMEF